MCIGGMNLYPHSAARGDETYFFARYGPTNGWATWRRAWKYFDVNLSAWPEFKRLGRVKDLFGDRVEQWYWTRILEAQHRQKIDTWDYQWLFALNGARRSHRGSDGEHGRQPGFSQRRHSRHQNAQDLGAKPGIGTTCGTSSIRHSCSPTAKSITTTSRS